MNKETPHASETGMPATDHQPPRKKGLNPLVIMLLVFGLPYALAWYFLYGGDPTEFESPNNHGVIVSPMIALPDYSLTQLDGEKISSSQLAGNWLLFTVSKKCDEACKRTLLVIRQSRKAMAVDRSVIKPILLLQEDAALEQTGIDFSEEFQSLSIITAESSQQSGLINHFSSQVESVENSIFMVDPFGNFMMVYPAETEQLGLLSDMKRLLKVNPVRN